MPLVLANNQPAKAAVAQPVAQPVAQAVEHYSPPPTQHAAAVVPVQIDAKKNDSLAASGLYLQVGAFANPDAAELLKSKLSQTSSCLLYTSRCV